MSVDGSLSKTRYAFSSVIREICELAWPALDKAGMINTAWAYYFFSVQFLENLEIALKLYPDDENLRRLEHEESNTDNLSPWPGVAQPGEKMHHCEFMRRALALTPIPEKQRARFEDSGSRYLGFVRCLDEPTRALSIASYEDGGLEAVFKAMLTMPETDNAALRGFRYFLTAHIAFDSDPIHGHGAMTRHLRPDDRILSLWQAFRDLLVDFAPALAAGSAVAPSAARTGTRP